MVTADAHCFNCEAYVGEGVFSDCRLPKLESPCAYISSVKQAENGNALICRISEYRGIGVKVKICLPENTCVVIKCRGIPANTASEMLPAFSKRAFGAEFLEAVAILLFIEGMNGSAVRPTGA